MAEHPPEEREGRARPAALTAATLPVVLDRIRARLAEHQQEIDELNVFPVPDGDTGSNLLATVTAAVEAARHADTDVPAAACRAALRGACGNSGVILSQVIRALTDALEEEDGPLGVEEVRAVLTRGRDLSYEAVADPVEGTMLTALDAAAGAAADQPAETGVADAVGAVVDAVTVAVARTQQQLPAAREAGVVDAGARGLEVVLAAVHEHLAGLPHELPPAPRHRRVDGDHAVTERESGSGEFSFEVQYLLHADQPAADRLRTQLHDLGDSVVVVAAGGTVKVHVHVNDVGAAIEAGQRHGEVTDIEVAAFADAAAVPAAPGGGVASAAGTASAEEVSLGVVTVVPGEGLREVVEQAGAVAVHGGPGDLPNVATLLEAIAAAPGAQVVVLPGHRNVVPTAEQAAAVSDAEGGRHVEVVTAAISMPAVLAALAVLDPAADPAHGVAQMRDAAEHVRAGEVVTAVRSAETPIGSVEEGELLTVVDGDVLGVASGPLEAVRRLVEHCGTASEVITVILGAEVSAEERNEVLAMVEDSVDAEVIALDGRQRPGRYLLGFE